MAGVLRSRTYLWLGAGTLALGVGAALASGSGIAHADSASTGSPGPSARGHHPAAASPSTPAVKKKPSAAHQVITKPGIASKSVALQPARAQKAPVAGAQFDLAQALAAQNQAITAQGQQIAGQGQHIANEEKAFGMQVRNVLTTTNFSTVTPRVAATELYYGVGSAVLLESAQALNGFAIGLNEAARSITALETTVVSQPFVPRPLAGAIYSAMTPIVNEVKVQANYAAGASAKFWVTAGAFESGFVHNLPPH
jgi:hypothetical protein